MFIIVFLIPAILVGVKWYLIVVLICTSLMADDFHMFIAWVCIFFGEIFMQTCAYLYLTLVRTF